METATQKKSAPIPRQSLSAAVVERVREKILSGELREGEQLRQDAIANEFQISRIPVREALSHLAAEGLITIYANRGAVVSALSPDEIMQLFKRLNEAGTTIIQVTHSERNAAYGNRIIQLKDGWVVGESATAGAGASAARPA